jgi:hypothetical protein
VGTDRKFILRYHFKIVMVLCELFLGGTQRKRVTSRSCDVCSFMFQMRCKLRLFGRI